jgi:SagB-type dehydrogenase family enzyme
VTNVVGYHDGTKHHFHQFARSLGYLDWASQPNPFRSFHGAQDFPLPPRPGAPPGASALGDLLRYSLGLSAWKQFRESRWSLRVNPSSGNLHPTEAYVVAGPWPGLTSGAAVYHYASDRHALEQRCAFEADAWRDAVGGRGPLLLVVLTSIHWREAWKYGERAFRYCQHDLGHAIAAVRFAASLAGWQARVLPDWSHAEIATIAGVARDEDYVDVEREEPGCVIAVASHPSSVACRVALVDSVQRGCWTGRASQLSDNHVRWTFIDDVTQATEEPGRSIAPLPNDAVTQWPAATPPYTAALILQRRSAVALDGRSSIDAERFFRMLLRVMPSDAAPWDTLWWDARIHLALFVHRIDGLEPGLYLLPRAAEAGERLRRAMNPSFLWERAAAGTNIPLVRLTRGACRQLAQRVSCDQAIAADGFFSLGMLADFDASLEQFGPSFYRHLFWESGVVGHVLYLEAEAAGARGTGIGCFYDDPVHETFGLTGHAFQSLYHFTVGMPVEDTRLTTEPGYDWER